MMSKIVRTKQITILILILISSKCLSQFSVDTFHVSMPREFCTDISSGHYSGSIELDSIGCSINNNVVSTSDSYRRAYLDTMTNILPENYAIFYKNNKIQESGMFYESYGNGPYKQYYENGNLRMEGERNKYGNKIGKWIYYKKSGNLRKELIYPEEKPFRKRDELKW